MILGEPNNSKGMAIRCGIKNRRCFACLRELRFFSRKHYAGVCLCPECYDAIKLFSDKYPEPNHVVRKIQDKFGNVELEADHAIPYIQIEIEPLNACMDILDKNWKSILKRNAKEIADCYKGESVGWINPTGKTPNFSLTTFQASRNDNFLITLSDYFDLMREVFSRIYGMGVFNLVQWCNKAKRIIEVYNNSITRFNRLFFVASLLAHELGPLAFQRYGDFFDAYHHLEFYYKDRIRQCLNVLTFDYWKMDQRVTLEEYRSCKPPREMGVDNWLELAQNWGHCQGSTGANEAKEFLVAFPQLIEFVSVPQYEELGLRGNYLKYIKLKEGDDYDLDDYDLSQ